MLANTNTYPHLSLTEMWEAAHVAIHDGHWGDARRHLDDLSYFYRHQAHEYLPRLEKYVSGYKLLQTASVYADVISDRIDQWNAHVDRRAMLQDVREYRTDDYNH